MQKMYMYIHDIVIIIITILLLLSSSLLSSFLMLVYYVQFKVLYWRVLCDSLKKQKVPIASLVPVLLYIDICSFISALSPAISFR